MNASAGGGTPATTATTVTTAIVQEADEGKTLPQVDLEEHQ